MKAGEGEAAEEGGGADRQRNVHEWLGEWPENPPNGVVVVLHGGPELSMRRPVRADPGRVRMAPFAMEIRKQAGDFGLAVLQPQYSVRGWNGAARSPVAGVDELLDAVVSAFGPIPVALVGHSMGGRIAATLAVRPEVAVVVGLAPWWPDDEGRFLRSGQRVLVLHGRGDRVVDPESSRVQIEAAARRGVDAIWHSMPGGHGMLRDWSAWHRLTAEFVVPRMIAAAGAAT